MVAPDPDFGTGENRDVRSRIHAIRRPVLHIFERKRIHSRLSKQSSCLREDAMEKTSGWARNVLALAGVLAVGFWLGGNRTVKASSYDSGGMGVQFQLTGMSEGSGQTLSLSAAAQPSSSFPAKTQSASISGRSMEAANGQSSVWLGMCDGMLQSRPIPRCIGRSTGMGTVSPHLWCEAPTTWTRWQFRCRR